MPAKPLAECLEAFWSPALSPARLRALATAPSPATPDLLLRMFPPPPVQVRTKDLAELLTGAYYQLAADDRPAGLPGDEGEPSQPTLTRRTLPRLWRAVRRGPDDAHGLRQAPPAQRSQPLLVIDRAQYLPQLGDGQEQVLHAELVEFLVIV